MQLDPAAVEGVHDDLARLLGDTHGPDRQRNGERQRAHRTAEGADKLARVAELHRRSVAGSQWDLANSL